MLDNLTQRLAKVVKTMRGEARLTESNTADMLREVRLALLEADVALPAVREFITRVKEKALGENVIGSLTPGQALVGVVQQELASLMGADLGPEASQLSFATQPPAIILMAGLQGAGKTTTVGKLAKYLREEKKKKVLTVSRRVSSSRNRPVANRHRPSRRRLLPVAADRQADRYRARGTGLRETALSRCADHRYRRPPRHRRSNDAGNCRATCGSQTNRDAVCGRCDARPGCNQHCQGVQRCIAADRYRADQT